MKGVPSKQPNQCGILSRVIVVVSISAAVSLSLLHYMYGLSLVDHKGKSDHMGVIVEQQQQVVTRKSGGPAEDSTEPILPVGAEDRSKSSEAVSESNTWTTDTVKIEPPVPCSDFIHKGRSTTSAVEQHPRESANPGMEKKLVAQEQVLNLCSDSVETALKTPQLTTEQYRWCQWALQNDGGQVQVQYSL